MVKCLNSIRTKVIDKAVMHLISTSHNMDCAREPLMRSAQIFHDNLNGKNDLQL